MAFDWKKAIGAAAPTLAQALVPGGPLVKAAVQAVGKALLGKDDATEDDVAKALAGGATMEQITTLKQVEHEFVEKMRALEIDVLKLDVQDRESARRRQVDLKDWIPAVLAVGIHAILGALLWALFTRHIPAENQSAANILLGVVGGGVTSVWAFYFGSSAGSKAKTDALTDIARASVVLLVCALGLSLAAPAAHADAASVLRPLTRQERPVSAFALERWSVEAALGARANGWMYSRGTQGFAEASLRYRWTNAIALDAGVRRIAVSKAPLEPEARVVLILAP